jgi:hypothetical protein
MTICEARIMLRSIRKLEAAKAELERLEADQVWRFWGLEKVVNNIEEISGHLLLIEWAEHITKRRLERVTKKRPDGRLARGNGIH